MKNERRFICESERIRDNCIAHLLALPVPVEGETDEQRKARRARTWEVEIRPYVKSKTAEQRAGFHWLCTILGNELGYDMDDIKEAAKRMALGTKEIRIGSDTFEVVKSSERNDGRPVNRIEYGALIDATYRLGSQAGITLPALDRWRRRAA